MSGLYTGKGDDGTTKLFACNQKISKSSSVAEAMGNLDELNSFLGIVKTGAEADIAKVAEDIQQDIFIISANLAGADKSFGSEKTAKLEKIVSDCEKELPPIKTFTIAGGSELSARLDFARTLARRAERRVVGVNDEFKDVNPEILKYMNRLSSVLFALARIANERAGIKESAPNYE